MLLGIHLYFWVVALVFVVIFAANGLLGKNNIVDIIFDMCLSSFFIALAVEKFHDKNWLQVIILMMFAFISLNILTKDIKGFNEKKQTKKTPRPRQTSKSRTSSVIEVP